MKIALGLGLTVAGIVLYRVETGLNRGLELLVRGHFTEAETTVDRYLSLHRDDPKAILVWAEAVISGNTRPPTEAAEMAIRRLQRIPDTAELAAEARMREGRLALLILHQPARAEQLLQHSVELDPMVLDSHYLLWKLLDLTERYQHSEPHFWQVYELTAESRRPERLREWYLSQFSPGTANADLDRKMGFLKQDQQSGPDTDLARIEQFYSSEPTAPTVVAALAQWYLRHRQRAEALELLMTIASDPQAAQDQFYLMTLCAAYLDLGRLAEARQAFERWPEPHSGFLYWSTAGRIFDLVDRDDPSAIDAYNKALAIWPGPAEWTLRHRKAQCQARHGDRAASVREREEAKVVEQLMEQPVHQKLRNALADLSRPETARQMAEFYDVLGRSREAKCWRELEVRLSARPASIYSPHGSGTP